MQTLVNSVKSCQAAIVAIKRSGAKVDNLIHSAVVYALAHYSGEGKGDASLLTNLVNAMPKSGRTNALKFYITAHANVHWVSDAKGDRFCKLSKAEFATSTVPTVPFWEFKKDTEQSDFNASRMIGSIQGVITRIDNAIKGGTASQADLPVMQSTKEQLARIVESLKPANTVDTVTETEVLTITEQAA